MILKTLDYRKSENHSGAYEEWNYFDNIVNASTYFHEDTKMTVVRCTFRDGNIITFSLTAYDEAGVIGSGTHKRAIISTQKFLDRTYAKL